MNFNIEKSSLVFVILILLFLSSCNEGVVNEQSSDTRNHVIIAYVVSSHVQGLEKIQANKLTHINYAFANIEDGSGGG